MRVIDLLQRIANGEEVPKYIKYYNRLHQKEDTMMCCYNNIIYKLDNNIIDLLDEVEIIEDKKIKKITMRAALVGDIDNKLENLDINIMAVEDKINEIIDKINKEEK